MIEWMKEILGDAYTEDIDNKITARLTADYAPKADLEAANTAKSEAEAALAAANDKYKDVDIDALRADAEKYKAEAAQARKDADERVAAVQFDGKLDAADLKAQLNRIEAQLELQDEQNRSIMKNQRLRMLLTIIITVVLLVVLGLFWNHMDQAYKEVMTACTQVNELADTLQSSLDTLDPDELNNMMQDLPAITEQLKQLDVDSLNTVLQGLPTLMDNVNKLQQQVETQQQQKRRLSST